MTKQGGARGRSRQRAGVRRQELREVRDLNDEVRQRAHAVLAALDEIEADVRRLI